MVMATKARVLGGDVVAHNAVAASVLGEMSVAEAAAVADRAAAGLPPDAGYATYAEFRERIRRQLAGTAGRARSVPANPAT
jgi:hypothetical protein